MEQLPQMYALSLDASIRRPIHSVDQDRVLLHAGHSTVILDTKTAEREPFQLENGHGIGCIAVHPAGGFLAIGGSSSRNDAPFVCTFKTSKDCMFELISKLRNGAKRKYDAMDFSSDGEMLATVSGDPDYFLTLWKWKTGDVVLRSKAFSREVYTVKFSPFFSDQLITSGVGHIKFWKIADTFTGMKLQGVLGKFGKLELVDIPDFVELQNGDVLSATENGNLLLWRNAVIKAVLRLPGNQLCHNGSINYTAFDLESKQILTAASDGMVKFWNPEDLPDYNVEESMQSLEVVPVRTIDLNQVSNNYEHRFGIKQLVQCQGVWTVFLESGGVIQLCVGDPATDLSPSSMRVLWDYCSGGISALVVFRNSDWFAVGSGDGVVSLYNARSRTLMYKSKAFSSAVTSLTTRPKTEDPEGRICVAGFEDGTIRVLLRCIDNWKLLSVHKPHNNAIALVKFSPAGRTLAAVSITGRVFFFFKSQDSLEPIGYRQLDESCCRVETQIKVSGGCFGDVDANLYIGTDHGSIFKVEVPGESLANSVSDNYRIDTLVERIPLSVENLAQDDQSNKETSCPVLSICSWHQDAKQRLLLSFGKELSGKVYCLSLQHLTIERVVTLHNSPVITCLSVLESSSSVFAGTKDGCVHMFKMDSDEVQVKGSIQVHDADGGLIRDLGISASKQTIITAAKDGTLFLLDSPWLSDELAEVKETERLPTLEEEGGYVDVEDITNPDAFTIDEAQQKEAEKSARQRAEDKKRRVRNYIEDLRVQLRFIKDENDSRPIDQKLSPPLLLVDENLKQRIDDKTAKDIQEVKRKYGFELEKELTGILKLKKRYFENIEDLSESLRGLPQDQTLSSFCIEAFDPELPSEMFKLENHAHSKEDITRSDSGDLQEAQVDQQGDIFQREEESDLKVISKSNTARRSQQRKKRQEKIRIHELNKPCLEEENTQDLAAIELAKNTIGDLKLKSDPNFVILEDTQDTPEKKRLEIAKLTTGMHQLQTDFNSAFRDLKERKLKLLKNATHDHSLLTEINNHLDHPVALSSELSRLQDKDDEMGMKQLACEINRVLDQVQTFKSITKIESTEQTPLNCESCKEPSIGSKLNQSKLMLMYKAHKIQKREEQETRVFKKDFQDLCLRKLDLQCDLNFLKLLKHVKEDELEQLEAVQQDEKQLEQKLRTKIKDKSELKAHITSIETQTERKLAEDVSSIARQQLLRDFDALLSSSHPHRVYLARILHQQDSLDQEEDSASNSERSELSSESLDLEDQPEDLDKESLNRVLKLKEKMSEINKAASEFQREIEALSKEKETFHKKLKLLDGSLAAIRSEIQEFRTQKQKNLNKVRSIVVLRPSQVQIKQSSTDPVSTEDFIIMDKAHLQSLAARPSELCEDRKELQRVHASLKKDFVQLKKDIKVKNKNLTDLEEKLEKMQMLKFGYTLDLDFIDQIQNQSPERSKNQSKSMNKHQMELDRLDTEIEIQKQLLKSETTQNTSLITQLLSHKSKEVEALQQMTYKAQDRASEQGGDGMIRSSREKTVQLVQSQAAIIVQMQRQMKQFKNKASQIPIS